MFTPQTSNLQNELTCWSTGRQLVVESAVSQARESWLALDDEAAVALVRDDRVLLKVGAGGAAHGGTPVRQRAEARADCTADKTETTFCLSEVCVDKPRKTSEGC